MVARPFLIAEAGVNHNGNLALAHRLIDAASQAGADAVKFQTFRTDALAGSFSFRARYQEMKTGAGDQASMLRGLEIPGSWYPELTRHCADIGIEFMSTPFHKEAVDLLLPLVKRLKIGSGDLTDTPLLEYAASKGKPIILSTGMAEMAEIQGAVSAIQRHGVSLSLLHCTSIYPAPFETVNLRAMATLRDRFGVPVGYSDHTPGISIPIAAAALGAEIIEKHFTVDRDLPGPDHQASLEPSEFARMTSAVREVCASLGDGRKEPAPGEEETRTVSRKSVVAARRLPAGEVLTREALAVKRPGTGIPPGRLEELLGKRLTRDADCDEPLTWDMIEENP